MPNEQGVRENEYVLAPGEYVYTGDQTTGKINTYVGPYKISLAGTDQPMVFDPASQKYERVQTVRQAVRLFPYLDERSYCILNNPSVEGNNPKIGTSSPQAELTYGRKINIKGPGTFPLWPGQSAAVIGGHQLKSNQYLIVKVYNEAEAKKNWAQSVMQPAEGTKESKPKQQEFVTGQLLIIKGTEVSFYIPPTGIEVLAGSDGKYVRDAVTLERLEYCILLSESGDKRYVRGPVVVFPSPTETFVELEGSRKFKALELNPQMGVHVKVIADYEEDGKKIKAGEELHITGETHKIYFPRAEHAIIKYGDQIITYAVAITSGEGRYVLNKDTGHVETVKGPKMFLPNPLSQVMINRVLSDREVGLWFPGNMEALSHNRTLSKSRSAETLAQAGTASASNVRYASSNMSSSSELYSRKLGTSMMDNVQDFAVAGDQLGRKNTFTPPRSITLDSKYEGAVRIDVWPGYAIQVVSKTGEREVVIGPKTVILDYDEVMEVLSLSRGVPKSTDSLLQTPYLKIKNNQITDVVYAETKDLVEVSFKVSYRVNFEGDEKLWFGTDNYVKLLTDHMRSLIRNAIKGYGIEEINSKHIDVIRNIVLGESIKTGDKGKGERTGRLFDENGMRIYDVEVFSIKIGDETISSMLINNQHHAVETTIEVAQRSAELEAKKKLEGFLQEIEKISAETRILQLDLKQAQQYKEQSLTQSDLTAKEHVQEVIGKIAAAELQREVNKSTERLVCLEKEVSIRKAESIDKIKAITPDLIQAIQNAYGMNLATTVAENLPNAAGTLGLLTGVGGIASLAKLFEGTPMADVFNSLAAKTKTK
jgi:major vault protein